jgi:polysaccharide export outer membrane protein
MLMSNRTRRWLLVSWVFLVWACGPPPQPIFQSGGEAAQLDVVQPLESLPITPHLQSYVEVDGFSEYVIGPTDVLDIVLRDIDLVRERVSVRPDGNISFLLLENVRLAGRTATQADSALTAELSHFLRDPKVDVEVEEYRSKVVSLLGALQALATSDQKTGQGRYPLKSKTTVLDLILEAGGPTPDARLDQVQLIRGTNSYELNIQHVLDSGEQSHNVVLQGGDIVKVPGANQLTKKVVVLGEVGLPSVYMFPTDAHLLEALGQAGGLADAALKSDIRVIRNRGGKMEMFTVNFERITKNIDLTQNVALHNNDIIFVPRSFIGDVNDALNKIQPLLDVLLLPATFRDLYSTGGGLRLDTGDPPEGQSGTVFTRPLGGSAKQAAPSAEEEDKEEE